MLAPSTIAAPHLPPILLVFSPSHVVLRSVTASSVETTVVAGAVVPALSTRTVMFLEIARLRAPPSATASSAEPMVVVEVVEAAG
jgi:hypothetical protein